MTRAQNRALGNSATLDGQTEQAAQYEAALKILNCLAATPCGDAQEVLAWCNEATACVREFVRLDGGKWQAWSTPAQRLAGEALKRATELSADSESLAFLGSQLPANVSVMSAGTGLAMLRKLAEWCASETQKRVQRSGPPAPESEGNQSKSASAKAVADPAGAEEDGATAGADDSEADCKSRLSPSRQKAYRQYLSTVASNPELVGATDRAVYESLQAHLEEGEKLPSFSIWARYLRGARPKYNASKYTRRAGRKTGRSIVRPSQI
jgi:hypothetical protein